MLLDVQALAHPKGGRLLGGAHDDVLELELVGNLDERSEEERAVTMLPLALVCCEQRDLGMGVGVRARVGGESEGEG